MSTEEGGLKRGLATIREHASQALHFVLWANTMCEVPEQTLVMYKDEVFNHCRSSGDYLKIIIDLLPHIKATRLEDVETLLDYWLDITAREAENDGIHTLEERSSAIALMGELWLCFPGLIINDRQNTIMFMLKRALREPYRLIKLTTTSLVFKLLDEFARTKNPAAPFLYKTLVFNLVEAP